MTGLIIALILIATLGTQAIVASRFDWRCDNCGQTFSIPPLKAAILPHRWGGGKFTTCPRCGVRSWVHRVPKESRGPEATTDSR